MISFLHSLETSSTRVHLSGERLPSDGGPAVVDGQDHTVPLGAYGKLPAAAPAGRTAIDTMNYYPDRDGGVAELDAGSLTSSELVQRHLVGSCVVKAFNNIDFVRLSAWPSPRVPPAAALCPSPGTMWRRRGR